VRDDDLTLDAGPAAAGVLAALHASAFDVPWDEQAFVDLLAQKGVFAVRHDDGFGLCRTIMDEAEILTLAVRPQARRHGLGRRLVQAMAEAAAAWGARRLLLEVAVDNVAAQGLYAACGFTQLGVRRGYYVRKTGAASDARILALDLASPLPSG